MKIKRLFLLAVAALALASCVKKPISAPDPAQGGEPVPVSFSLNLGGRLTKAAPASSVFDNASGEFTLYAAAFSKSTGALISTSKIGGSGYQPVETVTAENANVVLTLSKAQDYKVVIFAMHAGAYEVNFADGNVATFAYKSDLKANDASLDAFYAAVDVSGSTKKYDVAMKRPFAQLNLFVPTNNIPEGQTTFSSSMKVEAPASFNLVTGAAGTDVQELVFADNAIAADAVGNYTNTHVWIGMNYVLVPASGTVTLTSFVESGMKEAVRIGVVPVRPNARTNIVGSIYSLTEFAFNLQIDSSFGDEQEELVEVGEDGDEGGGGGGTTPVTATLTVSPTSLNLTVGQHYAHGYHQLQRHADVQHEQRRRRDGGYGWHGDGGCRRHGYDHRVRRRGRGCLHGRLQDRPGDGHRWRWRRDRRFCGCDLDQRRDFARDGRCVDYRFVSFLPGRRNLQRLRHLDSQYGQAQGRPEIPPAPRQAGRLHYFTALLFRHQQGGGDDNE